MFGTNASLAYGPQIQRHTHKITENEALTGVQGIFYMPHPHN